MFSKVYNFMSFRGVKIGIDLSWIFIALLLTWTLAVGYFPYNYPYLSSGMYWLMGFIGMLGLFCCIVLHEMGHALVAKHYKIPISQIVLFIFGGVSQIKQEPQSAKIEFLMAAAGPFVSFILILIMHFLTFVGVASGWPIEVIGITAYLAMINTVILFFNLIPAFPLDGGHIFRSILWGWKQNVAWANRVATQVGSGFGWALIFLGFFFFFTGNFIIGFWFAILGMFLRGAALASQTQFYVGEELRGENVIKFMKQNPITVPPTVTIKEFVDKYIYQSHHHVYPVTDNGDLVGYMGLNEVKSVPMEQWGSTLVQQVMVPFSKLHTVSPETHALDALHLIQQTDVATLFVVQGTRLLGILTAQDLFKTISLKLELESAARR